MICDITFFNISMYDKELYLRKLIRSKNWLIRLLQKINTQLYKIEHIIKKVTCYENTYLSPHVEIILENLSRANVYIIKLKQKITELELIIKNKIYFIQNICNYIITKRLANWISLRWVQYILQ